MKKLQLTKEPVAKTGMLIRRPPAEVYQAFADPEVTTKFWFTKGSGRLEKGGHVKWEWEMYGASADVTVKDLQENRRILIQWQGPGAPTTVEWVLTPHPDGTFVTVTESGFTGDGDAVVAAALGSTGGFTWVLAGLKAWLEHSVRLNLVADRYPKGLGEH